MACIDIRSAYHWIVIKQSDNAYTARKAGGRLQQFCRIPFGITNGVERFQRIKDEIILKEKLKSTFCDHDQPKPDKNLKQFVAAVEKYNNVKLR